ncbi:hypothetical protein RHGRI_008883 [Rhododendron griersonianum]|uniref:Uncharacterized protein n=1 Tax=Rhododendron griersonianum TaxID=479676 RepID=A0AAV6L354_9ERIC|nr:hypothetical protein RHGRI_008883 [Rhododendron griersonianum]
MLSCVAGNVSAATLRRLASSRLVCILVGNDALTMLNTISFINCTERFLLH